MKIAELIDGINKRDLVLPEFQREYVWNREQAKQLLVSLRKQYPVGGALFWKTDDPPELKNLTKRPEKLGTVSVILDGQQRLTTLHMLMRGTIPAYYTEKDIQTDPRELYYNIETGEFQYYAKLQMEDNPLWRRVVDCFTLSDINVFEIARQKAKDDKEAFELAKKYADNLTSLRQIEQVDIPVQTVPSHAGLTDAIDIFDRVNSQGTKLTDADLALTHVTGKWSSARRVMKDKIEELDKQHFYADLTLLTRALTGVVKKRALFETIHDVPRPELEAGWKTLSNLLDYVAVILPKHAFINSTDDMNTTNVLVPWFVYLAQNNGKFPSHADLKQAIHWLYAANIWTRYTSQTDQRLDHDVAVVRETENPWAALRDLIIDQRGRIEVGTSDLEGRGTPNPFYRMTLVVARAHDAIDWFNGVPLTLSDTRNYKVHSHHIFPQALLYRSGYDAENHLHKKIVNEIANRAFLTAESNLALADKAPVGYLSAIEEKYPGALPKQFVPMDPMLWRVENYEDFLKARRSLIAKKMNEFMQSLITEPVIVHKRPVRDLISMGESATLEFKSTLQWDVVQRRVNAELRLMVLKTVAAFLNSEGGTLLIGVDDQGNVPGLAEDLNTVHGSADKFQLTLNSLLSDVVGAEYSPLIKGRFESVDGKNIYILDIEKAPRPVFIEGPRGKEFFIRVGNLTKTLDPEATMKYTQTNWG